ncbi:Tim44 domain-containing protein [Maridesulfovibrio bastinii]|uniref:Tim44 domain-containing protein n=1 Tax=Maridesulfovibrio bastinii TaxID=47157 RepID=UPI0004812E88|nr:Tim44-like domain-containing protein [Maridesulfovibrio bastinii]
MKLSRILILLLTVFCIVAFVAAEASAKRFGGGRSFGGRSSYSNSFSRSAPSSSRSFGSSSRSSQTSSRTGFGRGGMGLMGGLLAGSLLGSMFFGRGGMGMGPGLLDFVLIGIVIFFALKFFRNRGRGSSGMQDGYYRRGPDQDYSDRNNYSKTTFERRSDSAWDHLSSKPSGNASHDQQAPEGAVPPDFDQEDFLKGAKAMYTRLQNSWDDRNLEDIKAFTTNDVYTEIARQASEDPGPSTTEILLVNARLLEVKDEGKDTVATVYYDVLLREDPSQSQPSQVREVWHFMKDNTSNGMWRLDGLQQLED